MKTHLILNLNKTVLRSIYKHYYTFYEACEPPSDYLSPETGLCYTPLSTVSGFTRVFEIGVHFESDDDSQLGQRSTSKFSLLLLLSLVYRKLVLKYNASLRTRKRLKWNVWWTLHRSIPQDSMTSTRICARKSVRNNSTLNR